MLWLAVQIKCVPSRQCKMCKYVNRHMENVVSNGSMGIDNICKLQPVLLLPYTTIKTRIKRKKDTKQENPVSNVMLLESLLSYHVVIIHKSRQNCPETDIFTARGDNQPKLHQINAAFGSLI